MITIYLIRNKINGKVYVGQTKQHINKRFSNHKSKARNGNKNCYKLYSAIRKYGDDNFTIEEIDRSDDLEIASRLEAEYIEKYNSITSGYNICHETTVHYHTTETKIKISKTKIGVPLSEQHKSNISKNHSKHFLGKKHTLESRKLISEAAQSRVGEKASFYGKEHTEKTRQLISKTKIDNKTSVGESNPAAKLTQEKVNNIRLLISQKQLSIKDIAKLFKVSTGTIRSIQKNRIWKI